MTDYEAYKLYCAVKRHFNSERYDYFKYNGSVRASYSAFEKRNDKYFFVKLAKHKDVLGYLVANLYQSDVWVGDLVNEQVAEQRYREWLKRKESLSYIFKNEVGEIDDIKEEMRCKGGQHPVLFRKYLSREICAETLIIIDRIYNKVLFKYWDSELKDPVWKNESNRLKKLSPFVVFDEDKYRHMVDFFRPTNEDRQRVAA